MLSASRIRRLCLSHDTFLRCTTDLTCNVFIRRSIITLQQCACKLASSGVNRVPARRCCRADPCMSKGQWKADRRKDVDEFFDLRVVNAVEDSLAVCRTVDYRQTPTCLKPSMSPYTSDEFLECLGNTEHLTAKACHTGRDGLGSPHGHACTLSQVILELISSASRCVPAAAMEC